MVSTGSLLRLSASAAVMNAIVPLSLMVQLALLGRRATALQASFGSVVTATSFGSVVFNFLVDGVTAKVGKSVGSRRYREAAGQVRMAFLAALVCGGVAAATLLSLRDPLFSLFRATPEVARHARPYFFVRAAAAPAQCAANAASGCLGGYGRVHAATALSVCRALAEAAAVAAAVALAETDASCFAWIGFAYAACALANAAAGAALVAALPPEGSDARLPVMASFSFSFSRVPTAAAERAEETELELDAYASGASFVADGASMFARAFLLQGTFFGAMVVASRELGPAGLAAHNVVCQLWLLSSYVVDGFATAGNVCGARLVGEAAGKRKRSRRANANENEPTSDPTTNRRATTFVNVGTNFGGRAYAFWRSDRSPGSRSSPVSFCSSHSSWRSSRRTRRWLRFCARAGFGARSRSRSRSTRWCSCTTAWCTRSRTSRTPGSS